MKQGIILISATINNIIHQNTYVSVTICSEEPWTRTFKQKHQAIDQVPSIKIYIPLGRAPTSKRMIPYVDEGKRERRKERRKEAALFNWNWPVESLAPEEKSGAGDFA